MAYTKQTWQNEVLSGVSADQALFTIKNSSGTIINDDVIIELKSTEEQAGSEFTADRMNHIEDGIEANSAAFNASTGHDHDGTNSKKIAASNVDGLADYFDASTGHDHDGTDSKKIAYANITGTPTIPTVPSFETSASNIKADGTASVGSLSTLARADHVHPNNDTGWISVTLENSWTVYTDWAGRFQYRKLFGGIVMLKLIAVYNASNQSAGNILTTLPANYYPVNDLHIATYATNGAFDSVLQIQNGVVKLKTAYTADVKLFASVVYFIG